MGNKLDKLMNWRDIEGVVYADLDHPFSVLGERMTTEGRLIGAFLPDAQKVSITVDGVKKKYPMEEVDEAGFFAALLPKTSVGNYQLTAAYPDGVTNTAYDAYQFHPQIDEKELKKFNAGIHYEVYKILGAHPTTLQGVAGVQFAVWAPEAKRVSVVGDFNLWDGRKHIMERLGDSGVFALFIPELPEGSIYKYEIATKNKGNVLKTDPYGNAFETRPANASKVVDITKFTWTDDAWIAQQKKNGSNKELPVSIYEVHLGSWRCKELPPVKEGEEVDQIEAFYNYREIAPLLADYCKEMGYTHVELMPVMEHPFDGSWGYQVSGYYAPTSRYGSPEDFMYFMNYMHNAGVGVILDWVPAHFPRDAWGMAEFDGTCLYEHRDPRQGSHPHWGTLIYNYGRPEVSNFLIANALFWAEQYHADGIRMDAIASMLYLDYGKNDGEWIPNIYGGKENLEAVEFLKHLNSIFKKRGNYAMLIAEESTAWPQVTGSVKEDGLGFDYKWNMGWMNDFLGYMQTDPYFRKYQYGGLTFSMIYAYSENFVLILSHDEVVHGKGSMIQKMPGTTEAQKFANLRAAYGFQMTHPGKKLLFMGQEFAMFNEWWEAREIDWFQLENTENKQMQDYVKALNHLYLSEPALYEQDYDTEGFSWINNISSNESILVFVRKAKAENDFLVVVCNFDTIDRDNYKIGVPKEGKYKEIFNSDNQVFGGNHFVNPRVKPSKKEGCDGMDDSIRIKVPALGMTVLRYVPVEKKEDKTSHAGTRRNNSKRSGKSGK
jgi:1,4-alpha-glucan branching enzyme